MPALLPYHKMKGDRVHPPYRYYYPSNPFYVPSSPEDNTELIDGAEEMTTATPRTTAGTKWT